MDILGIYFSRTGQRDIAQKYDEILQEIASAFPIAKMLHRELHPGILIRVLQWLLREKSP
jgi:hypothetical protein